MLGVISILFRYPFGTFIMVSKSGLSGIRFLHVSGSDCLSFKNTVLDRRCGQYGTDNICCYRRQLPSEAFLQHSVPIGLQSPGAYTGYAVASELDSRAAFSKRT